MIRNLTQVGFGQRLGEVSRVVAEVCRQCLNILVRYNLEPNTWFLIGIYMCIYEIPNQAAPTVPPLLAILHALPPQISHRCTMALSKAVLI